MRATQTRRHCCKCWYVSTLSSSSSSLPSSPSEHSRHRTDERKGKWTHWSWRYQTQTTPPSDVSSQAFITHSLSTWRSFSHPSSLSSLVGPQPARRQRADNIECSRANRSSHTRDVGEIEQEGLVFASPSHLILQKKTHFCRLEKLKISNHERMKVGFFLFFRLQALPAHHTPSKSFEIQLSLLQQVQLRHLRFLPSFTYTTRLSRLSCQSNCHPHPQSLLHRSRPLSSVETHSRAHAL